MLRVKSGFELMRAFPPGSHPYSTWFVACSCDTLSFTRDCIAAADESLLYGGESKEDLSIYPFVVLTRGVLTLVRVNSPDLWGEKRRLRTCDAGVATE